MITGVTDTVKEGIWRISYFYDSGKDETGNFTGYNFTFGTTLKLNDDSHGDFSIDYLALKKKK